LHTKTLPLVLLNTEPDGTFPNHSPNPIAPGAADQAATAVREHNAIGGCVFDADADRVTFLDEQGNAIHPNTISCLLIERILARNPGATVAHDLISSRAVPELIERLGGTAVRTKVGRASVIDAMLAHDAVFGAETSSHLMFKETFYGEAATLAMLLVIDTVSRSSKPFSALTKQYKQYALLPETNYSIEDKLGAMQALEQAFPDATADHLDGVCLTFTDGWIVARASNTEPILRLRGEANSHEVLFERLKRAEDAITRLGGTPTKGH
jgi:phosphomannomutase